MKSAPRWNGCTQTGSEPDKFINEKWKNRMRELLLPKQHIARTKGRERGVRGQTESAYEEKKCGKQDRGERVREGSERE